MTTGDRDEYALQLHARLVALDPVAPSEFAAAFLPELVRRLRARAGPGHDESLLQDAATDAVLDYLQHPSKFDPRKSGLFTYLTMAAYRDLLNSLAKERRRYQHEVSLEDVEEALPDGNNVLEASSPAVDEASPVSMDEIMHSLVTEFPDARDRRSSGTHRQRRAENRGILQRARNPDSCHGGAAGDSEAAQG